MRYRHKDGIDLRKISREDLPVLLQLKEEWHSTHHTSILNLDDQTRWYERLASDELYMVVEKNETPVGIGGYTQIDWLARTLEISGSIFQEHRKLDEIIKPAFAAGLDFAFEILNMHRVGAEVLVTNVPAQWLEINYLGFKVEGTRRQAVYKSGNYYDSIVLGILREEWRETPRVRQYCGSCNRDFDVEFAEKAKKRATLKYLGEQASPERPLTCDESH